MSRSCVRLIGKMNSIVFCIFLTRGISHAHWTPMSMTFDTFLIFTSENSYNVGAITTTDGSPDRFFVEIPAMDVEIKKSLINHSQLVSRFHYRVCACLLLQFWGVSVWKKKAFN